MTLDRKGARVPTNLRYIGDGAFVPGVPATDLNGIAADQARELIATGLYAPADDAKGAVTAPEEGDQP